MLLLLHLHVVVLCFSHIISELVLSNILLTETIQAQSSKTLTYWAWLFKPWKRCPLDKSLSTG